MSRAIVPPSAYRTAVRVIVDEKDDEITVELSPPASVASAPPENRGDSGVALTVEQPIVRAGHLQPGPLQLGPLQPGSLQPGSLQSKSLQTGPIEAGNVQPASLLTGPIQAGRILRNRYVVESLLGRGGMGDVYRASDGLEAVCTGASAQIAVKVLKESVRRSPQQLIRLQREFDCVRKLSHPNIVNVYQLDRDADLAFYTMELLEGEHVADILRQREGRPLPQGYAWAIVRAIGAALAHAHSRNVVHGDVSPKNVMITRNGEVRVLDFGSSIYSDPEPPGSSAVLTEAGDPVAATPAYASCELLEGQTADPRDDLYALACVAYELLAGEHPFQRKRSIDARNLGMRARRPPSLSVRRWRTIQRGLSWSRENRSLTIRDWLRQLGLPPEPQCLPTLQDAEAAASSERLAFREKAAVLSLFALAFSGIGWNSLRHPTPERAVAPTASAVPQAVLSGAAGPGAAGLGASSHGAAVRGAGAVGAAGRGISPPAATRVAQSSNRPPQRIDGETAGSATHSVLEFLADRYAIVSGAHFVETHVWRSRAARDSNSPAFVWWTEGSSAKAGLDFLAQARTPVVFFRGRQHASLFVRLLPNAERTHSADFRVCIGRPGIDSSVSKVACCSIVLSPPASIRRG